MKAAMATALAAVPEVDGQVPVTPCRSVDPDLWFSDLAERKEQAIELCEQCPVSAACLRAALAEERGTQARYRYGIWGGRTPDERYHLHRHPDRSAGGLR